MLKRVTVINLQGFGEGRVYEIPLTSETVFIGPNNSGKSTIFNAINMIRHVWFHGQIEFTTALYNLVNFDEAVYMHETDNKIAIRVDVEDQGHSFVFSIAISRGGLERFEVSRAGVTSGNDRGQDVLAILSKIWYFTPVRQLIPHEINVGNYASVYQPLQPTGYGVGQFLLQKYTEQDPSWQEAKIWLNKIDHNLVKFKTPLRYNQTSIETTRSYGANETDINLSLQGTGIQNAATIIAAVIFSPNGSTIMIEEPENFLHPRSQEVLVDLFNYAANELDKQIIISTHSRAIMRNYTQDLQGGLGREGKRDAAKHKITDPARFSLVAFQPENGPDKVSVFDLTDKKYTEDRRYVAELLG